MGEGKQATCLGRREAEIKAPLTLWLKGEQLCLPKGEYS